jgi:hypothetical protein
MGRVRRNPALLASSVVVAALIVVLLRAGCTDETSTPSRDAPTRDPRETPPPPLPPKPVRGKRTPEPEPSPADPLVDGNASSQKPSDEVEEPLNPGELPDDELGTGDCVLRLRLVDDDGGRPVESAVRIWRYGVAASSRYTAGDQVQRRIDVPAAGAVVTGLPPGRYRVEVDAVRRAAEDPPEFTVAGETDEVVRVATPRSFPVRCVVVGQDGARLNSALHRTGTYAWESPQPRPAPAWSAPRRSVRPGSASRSSPDTTGGVWGADAPPERIVAGVFGFELGVIAESSRGAVYRASHLLDFDGSSTVRVWAGSQDAGRGDYVAVTVPLDVLVAHVRLGDGRSLSDAGATVTATSNAVARTPQSPPDLWRTVPVSVTVSLPGYAPLRFEWRAADPPRDSVTLSPAPDRK